VVQETSATRSIALSDAVTPAAAETAIHSLASGVTCARCRILDKTETDCVRRLEAAQTRLHSFCPEPPYSAATVNELETHQRAVEYWRAALDKAKRERSAHFATHSMTLTP